jgi:hypothetical protein
MVCKSKVSCALVGLFVVSALAGCGSPGAPEPPSLNLPLPVNNLSAVRVGGTVGLAWTMPTRTTDRVILKHAIDADVCRAVDALPCASIAHLMLAPGAAGKYEDQLPPELTKGPDRLMRYEIAARNHAGKSAGPSNLAYSAAGVSPSGLTGLSAKMQKDGALLSWQPEPPPEADRPVVFRIQRRLLVSTVAEEAPRSPLATPLPPQDETLAVHSKDGVDPGHALDTSALFNQQYRYVVERVVQLSLAGQPVEIEGSPSQPVTVSTKDTFPPEVPQGLAAVADTAGGAIDLSWSPGLDSDLAAYRVYRRDAHANLPAQRIASIELETSFRDTSAQRGHTYAYSVSAVDQAGNESQASAEVEEALPAH